jgi:hypothetical protein
MLEPFHVSSFCPPESKNAVLGQDIQTEGVDAFLVQNNKVFLLLFAIHGLVANKVLELYNLLDLLVDELPFSFDQLFTLLGRRIEEARVDLTAKS